MYASLVVYVCLFLKVQNTFSALFRLDCDVTEARPASKSLFGGKDPEVLRIPGVTKRQLYAMMLKELKAQTLAKLKPKRGAGKPGLDEKTGEPTLPTTVEFKEKTGELYANMLIEILERAASENKLVKADENKTKSSLGFGEPPFNDSGVACLLYEEFLDTVNQWILDCIAPETSPGKPSSKIMYGFDDDGDPLNLVNMEGKIMYNALGSVAKKIIGLFGFEDEDESLFIGFDESGSYSAVDIQVEMQKLFTMIFKQLETQLANKTMISYPVKPFVKGFDENGDVSSSAVNLTETAGKLRSVMQKELTIQELVTSVCKRSPGKPGIPSLLGLNLTLEEANKTLKDNIKQYGSIYTKLLEDRLKTSFTLKDFNVGFNQMSTPVEPIFGNITFTQGSLELNTSLKVADDSPSIIVNRDHLLISYVFKVQKKELHYQFLVEVPSGQLEGTFQARLNNVQVDATMLVTKEDEAGKCSYESLGLHFQSPDLNTYAASFNIKNSIKSRNSTEIIIINTFILRYLLKNGSKMPLIYDTLGQISRKVIQQATEEFHSKLKTDLCYYYR